MRAGRDVHVGGPIAGDVAAAGADVTIDGDVAGYVMSAGRHVTLNGEVGNDLWAAGETVDVTSTVRNNAMLAGRSVTLHRGATVDGSARLAGDTVRSEGRVSHDLRLAGSTVTIGGDVGGAVSARGERISVLPNTIVRGDFIVQSPKPPEIAPDAQILGLVRHEPPPTRRGWMTWPDSGRGRFSRCSCWAPRRSSSLPAFRVTWPQCFADDRARRFSPASQYSSSCRSRSSRSHWR
jgi:cytoskeletal protein CcmA (bactofilin family)